MDLFHDHPEEDRSSYCIQEERFFENLHYFWGYEDGVMYLNWKKAGGDKNGSLYFLPEDFVDIEGPSKFSSPLFGGSG